ncbi:MAG TPA: hypothetical protein VME92_05945 [Acetobacteraceae bacterium]|nr:hypothetical protein [Acetobacteraceae bacterium]
MVLNLKPSKFDPKQAAKMVLAELQEPEAPVETGHAPVDGEHARQIQRHERRDPRDVRGDYSRDTFMSGRRACQRRLPLRDPVELEKHLEVLQAAAKRARALLHLRRGTMPVRYLQQMACCGWQTSRSMRIGALANEFDSPSG